jgi:hypothetical protein
MISARIVSLLGLDLRKIIESIEHRCGIKLPREATEVYLDRERDLLFIRFREPRNVEVGEPFVPRCLFNEYKPMTLHLGIFSLPTLSLVVQLPLEQVHRALGERHAPLGSC